MLKNNFVISFILILSIFFTYCKKKETVSPGPTTVFHDDFVDDRNNWFEKNNDTVLVSIQNDSLFFTNKNLVSGFSIWNKINIDQGKNFSIKATITKKSGVDNYGYGINWGILDTKNYYTFLISQNGYFCVYKSQNGTGTFLMNWTAYSAIKYNGANTLEIKKDGSALAFYVNGVNIFTSSFQSFFGNGVGFDVNNNIGIAVSELDISQW